MYKIKFSFSSILLILLCPNLVLAQSIELPNIETADEASIEAIDLYPNRSSSGKLNPASSSFLQPKTLESSTNHPTSFKKSVEDLPANFSNVKPAYQQTSLKHLGLVQEINLKAIKVRSIDGQINTYKISPNIDNAPPISSGTLISYNASNRVISQIALPIVKDVFEGALVLLEDNQLGLISTAGQVKVTSLSQDKIASMNLVVGQTIRVVEFEGIKSKVIASPNGNKAAPIYIGEINPERYSYNYR